MEETKEEIKQEGDFKIKKKPGRPRKLTSQKEPVKLDLNKTKEEDAVQAQETSDSDVAVEEKKDETGSAEVVEEIRDAEEVKSTEEEQSVVISEVPAEEIKTEEPIVEETKRQLPEGIDKLVSFMEETGGTMSDYIRLNADYSNVDEDTLLKEYYKNTKPHLDAEEINFIMEEQFKVDEDYDEEREVRRKKLAKKEEVAKAKNFLEDLKVKYYEEIKSRPTVNNEMTKANEFFNKFKQQQEIAKQQHEQFKTKTNKLFSEEFKGFEFNLGDKRFRYSVNNASSVGESQSDISNVVKKFLNEKGEVVDVEGYHKAMYAANNADTIAQHFYEQGKADATKNIVANSKNINKEVRTKAPEDLYLNGFKLKAVSGMNSSKLKINKK